MSFNSKHLLPRAIQSVLDQTYGHTEIIVVDNHSTDGTIELLDIYVDVARVLLLEENTGYARGMNRGYEAAGGEFLIPLNTDAVLHPTFISEAVRLFEQHVELGVIAAEVLKIDETGEWRFWLDPQHDYESEGGVVALSRQMRVHVIEDNNQDFRLSFKANGACPVIRRKLLHEIEAVFGFAPFDPVFDTYGEDVDFAFKAWSLRWHTMYVRRVLAGHVRSYASPLELPDKRGRLRINLIAERYVNAVRHLPTRKLAGVIAAGIRGDAGMLARQLRKGDMGIVRDLAIAFARLVRLLPSLVRFRRTHHTWRSIDFEREVYCEQTRTDEQVISAT